MISVDFVVRHLQSVNANLDCMETMIDQSRRWFFAPDEDTITPFIAFIKSAKKKVRIADYSFNLEPLVETLIEQTKAGLDIMLVLDKTQAAGPSERPIIAQLKAANVKMMIGTSDAHKIMHDKFAILDDEWIQGGSWNYTATAAKEDNFYFIEHNPQVAQVFTQKWQKMWDWISQHEPQ